MDINDLDKVSGSIYTALGSTGSDFYKDNFYIGVQVKLDNQNIGHKETHSRKKFFC